MTRNCSARRAYVHRVDDIAKKWPSKVYASVPRRNWEQDGWEDVTFQQMAKGIDHVASWIDNTLGSRRDFQTLAYTGPNDLRYAMILGAAMKTKRKVLFMDSVLPTAARMSLIEATDCSILVCTEDTCDAFQELQNERPAVRMTYIPSLEECLATEREVESFSYDLDLSQSLKDPVCVLHTSGTTGNPKPIVMTYEAIATWEALFDMPVLEGESTTANMFSGRRLLNSAPFYWVIGLLSVTLWPSQQISTPVLLPTDAPRPLAVEYLLKTHERARFDIALYPPAVLKEFCKNTKALKSLGNLDLVVTAGAPLDKWAGDLIWQYVPLQQCIGTTEVGGLISYASTADDWQYFRFHKDTGYRMDKYEDDLFELVIERKPELAKHQSIFIYFPESNEYRTGDLYKPHPELPDYWLHAGRCDDFVKTSQLARFRAAEVENTLERHPRIKAAVMGGDGREQPFVIVEAHGEDGLPSNKDDKLALMDEIWEAVEKANETTSTSVRIPRELIILADAERPLPRLGKGTVNRRQTLVLFEKDIDGVYAAWNGV